MANKRDYYEILGLAKAATEIEITKAYRKLAMQHHPDRNVGDTEAEIRFKEVTEAYEVLRDPQKRQLYDRHGHAGLAAGGDPNAAHNPFDLIEDLLGSFFGGQGRRGGSRGPRAGRDIQAVLDIDLVEAATGCKKTQTVPREEICRECGGTGAKSGTQPARCQRCGGRGEVITQNGWVQFARPCPGCGGRGEVVADPCRGCGGQKRVEVRRTIEVDIPAGVDTGNRISYSGEGDAGEPGAPHGDLVFVIRVREHRQFHRDGHNLVCQWPITFAQAALGGPVEITTLTGHKVVHQLPRGIQTHEVLRIPGHGMPNPRGGRKGDLLVQVVVETPTQLTPEQEQLFRKIAELEHSQVATPRKGFFGKLKDLFAGDGLPTDEKK